MKKQHLKLKNDVIRWRQFSRRGDAIFRSLHKEITIGILTVATLTFAAPQNATARTVMGYSMEASDEGGINLDDVEVTASRVSMPLEQTARIVTVVTREEIENCPARTVSDLLKYASGVDVRQRGAYGIQTDISIDGGTHDQIVILINGVNVSSPHTGHLATDFPFNIDDVERVEILEGAASRVFGSSAYSGVINIVTKGSVTEVEKLLPQGMIRLSGGSCGTAQANSAFSLSNKNLYNYISAGYSRSDGAVNNSDFIRLNAFYNGGVSTEEIDLKWQAGISRKDYGANTFYSGKFPNQYEENRNSTIALMAKTKGRIQVAPTLYWNRANDHYQLIRGMSPTQENYHRTDVYGAGINLQTEWVGGISSVGAELRNEGILSTALGTPLAPEKYVNISGTDRQFTKKDNRTNICYHLEHNILLNRFTISMGLMANMNTWLDHRFRLYPGVDVSWRPVDGLKIYAVWSVAQRMPTFTDIYYKSPTQVGYAELQPEHVNEFCVGGKWQKGGFDTSLRIYYRHQTDMIDWVIPEDSVTKYGRGIYTTYHATNLRVNNIGASASIRYTTADKRLSVSAKYMLMNQVRKDDIRFDDSYYGLNYLRNKVVVSITAHIWKDLSATLAYRFQDRAGTYYEYDTSHMVKNAYGWDTYLFKDKTKYRPFSLFDIQLRWQRKHYELFADFDNITNQRYVDIGNVVQPGFWFMGGVKLKL